MEQFEKTVAECQIKISKLKEEEVSMVRRINEIGPLEPDRNSKEWESNEISAEIRKCEENRKKTREERRKLQVELNKALGALAVLQRREKLVKARQKFTQKKT